MSGFLNEIELELNEILDYWTSHAVDEINGGFVGRVSEENNKIHSESKGLILNARILWTYSAAFNYTRSPTHFDLARRAFTYLIKYFYDELNKGFYWLIDKKGVIIDDKKHIYAQSFVVYGLSEYFKISGDQRALDLAIETYQMIIEKSKDNELGGFAEAFSNKWESLDDVRLSDKDVNVQKTMNTHLHIVEAFVTLYSVWKDKDLKQEIISILYLIEDKFIDESSGHLKLFFDTNWHDYTDIISYGHDVEAAWLLLQCAEIIQHEDLINRYRNYAILFIDSSIIALDGDGGLWYEMELVSGKLVKEKHWWPQAEFMIGAINAYELTNDKKYLDLCLKTWNFIKQKIKDPNGEWHWGIDSVGNIIADKYKIGFWKCPYHSTRMCLELLKRLNLKN